MRFGTLAVTLLCALATHLAAHQPSPSAVEQRLAAFADSARPDAEALLERAVNINSGTMNLPGVRRVGDLFADELKALGFRTTWIDGSVFKRAGHLVAQREGKGAHLLLIGHLDTVFEADSPFQKFERLTADAARGPGIIDMKGATSSSSTH